MPETDPHPPTQPGTPSAHPNDTSARDAYNVVSDTVIGVNIRWKDNLFQAVFILASMFIGSGVGLILAKPGDRLGFLIVGAIAGMIFGVFTSGLFLMIYRAARHARGKHD